MFDINAQISIFDPLFAKRPEIDKEQFKLDLTRYYLPFVQKLIDLKKKKEESEALIIGVSAIQGAGKTTQGEILEILLSNFGYSSVSRSIDDHYVTHQKLCEFREGDPRFIRRGVTHDILLATRDLKDLQQMESGSVLLVSGYDKGAQFGDGDRFRWINPSEGIRIKVKVLERSLVVNKQTQNVLGLEIISATYNNNSLFLPSNMGSDIPLVEPMLSKELIDFLQNHKDQELIVTLENEDNVLFCHSREGGNPINNQDNWIPDPFNVQGKQVRDDTTTKITIPKNDLPNGWRMVTKKPNFIFYDGWLLGARRVEDESVFDSGLPALETDEYKQFAKDVNGMLDNYLPLWQMLDFLNVLYVKNYQMSLQWRDQAEGALRAKGGGMTHEQIQEFVYYFWRSVHPGIHIKNLAGDTEHTNQVVIINDDHSVGDILTPDQVKENPN